MEGLTARIGNVLHARSVLKGFMAIILFRPN
jgi:hypothetical protein